MLVKKLNCYDERISAKQNYSNIVYNRHKFILPILDKYHTTLLPDSKLNNENEIDFLGKLPHRYALQKVYISWSWERNIHNGEFLNHCQNRSVFNDSELEEFWAKHRNNIMIIKFKYVKKLEKRLTLEYLWSKGIITPPEGPRPFTRISDNDFDNILIDSKTKIDFADY